MTDEQIRAELRERKLRQKIKDLKTEMWGMAIIPPLFLIITLMSAY